MRRMPSGRNLKLCALAGLISLNGDSLMQYKLYRPALHMQGLAVTEGVAKTHSGVSPALPVNSAASTSEMNGTQMVTRKSGEVNSCGWPRPSNKDEYPQEQKKLAMERPEGLLWQLVKLPRLPKVK
ncbi:hypothetical protein B0H14DRAFT_2578626 [Mycena olivaceomarginata]|nr:hypothetical protein B0H14DRAFT_2578626 [Mycena olivaceomarginata]